MSVTKDLHVIKKQWSVSSHNPAHLPLSPATPYSSLSSRPLCLPSTLNTSRTESSSLHCLLFSICCGLLRTAAGVAGRMGLQVELTVVPADGGQGADMRANRQTTGMVINRHHQVNTIKRSSSLLPIYLILPSLSPLVIPFTQWLR